MSAKDVKKRDQANPQWLVPTMIGLMIAGLVWILVGYISQMQWPIPEIGNWNLAIGFGLAIAGFLLTTKWK